MSSSDTAPKPLTVGGQAVVEGVMMRGVSSWAVATRLPEPAADGKTIMVHDEEFTPVLSRRRIYRLPVLRGMIALVESLKIGVNALFLATNAQLPATEAAEAPVEISGGAWATIMIFGLVFTVGLFFVLPVVIANSFGSHIHSSFLFILLEKAIRLTILIGYIWLISLSKGIRRVYEYHGAEHKTIAAYEAGVPLTPEEAQKRSRFHVRCGTSFLLLTVIVAFLVFLPLGKLPLPWLIFTRIIGLPLIIGLSYEVIRVAGKHQSAWLTRVLMWPGLQLQRITTREPDLSQLEVAIAALQATLKLERKSKIDQSLPGLEVGA